MHKVHVVVFVAAWLAVNSVQAQTQQASVSGSVRDAQGAFVPDVEVAATNVATGLRFIARSNGAGFYQLQFMPIGTYTIAAQHSGFKGFLRDGLILTTGLNLRLDIDLELGATTETITVTGGRAAAERQHFGRGATGRGQDH